MSMRGGGEGGRELLLVEREGKREEEIILRL